MSVSALIKATESLKKREGDLLPTLKTIFFEGLKHKYQRKTIREVLIESKGGSWGNDYFKEGIKAKVLRSPDIRLGFIDYENAEERFFTQKEIDNFNLKNDDILVIKSNGSLDLVGKSQIYKVNNKFPFVIASNFLMVLSPNAKIIYPEYLDLFLKSPESLVWRFDTQKTTTGLRNLSSQAFLNIDIPVPATITEQIKLFNLFSQFMEGKIENDELEIKKFYLLSKSKAELFSQLTSEQDLLNQLSRAFLREAMQGKLVKQDKKEGNARDLLKKIKAEKEKLIAEKKSKKEKELTPIKEEEIPFEIPENWVWCRLGDILDVLTDYHANGAYEKLKSNVTMFDEENFAIMLRTTNFHSKNYHEYKYISKDAYDFLGKSKVYAGDLIMNKIGDPGTVFLVNERGKPMSLAMNLFLLRLNKSISNFYIYSYLKMQHLYIKSFSAGTTSMTITKDAVKELMVPLPPLAEQKRIVKKLEEVMNLCEELKTTITDNQNYTNQLLQVALKNALQMNEENVSV